MLAEFCHTYYWLFYSFGLNIADNWMTHKNISAFTISGGVRLKHNVLAPCRPKLAFLTFEITKQKDSALKQKLAIFIYDAAFAVF